jgi:HAD superfamily hydrolase (TIGR01509 family)
MAALEWIFWDNDGVLVDTEDLYFQASAELLRETGVELSREQFVEISLRRGESVFDLAEGDKPYLDSLRQRRNRRYAELLAQGVAPIAGVPETLRALHGRFRMAIVTSSHRDHFDLIHQTTGLRGYFDFILTREDYRHTKPHPEPYLTALARSTGDPARCLVVEDSQRGLEAAVAAGLRCLVIPGDLNRHSDFSTAHAILQGIAEVPDYLR